MESLPQPLLVTGNLAENWKIFRQNYENYMDISRNFRKSSDEQLAIFINILGADGLNVFNSLNLSESQLSDIKQVIKLFELHCLSCRNNNDLIYERTIFNQRIQRDGESFADFLRDVQALAGKCKFGDLETEKVKQRLLLGLADTEVKEKLSLIPNVTLENVVGFCKSSELLKVQHLNDRIRGSVVQHRPSDIHYNRSTECVLQNGGSVASGLEVDQSAIEMRPEHMCGISCWHPSWLQKYATTKTFLIVYGLLGTTQAMAFLYFVVTLTTLEKRFKIPSQTTGIILSGNEISQILLSLILSYAGGQRNRPRWISWGVVFCSLSCFILAMPHFIYGGGEDALHLTQEWLDMHNNNSYLTNSTVPTQTVKGANKLCVGETEAEECDELFSYVPLVLIFLSQFVLGIGNTLYYSLGQTYLDDNTKKTNTPMMLAYAMSLRMFGPVVGFLLGYITLNIYIDPSKTPLINNKDPRWLGAWWLGWIILGFSMLVFAVLIGMFPKELPKKKVIRDSSETPKMLYADNEDMPMAEKKSRQPVPNDDFPKLKDFPSALMRLLRNKILMYNILSGIFYILGSSGYITFLSKYMEVQFNKSPSDATIITGPVTIVGMVTGFILSGYIISKYKPGPRKLFFWNVIVGIGYMVGQVIYLFLTCDNTNMMNINGAMNLTNNCNMDCSCDGVAYSPICYEGTTYFSPCHAGCGVYNDTTKQYSNCKCLDAELSTKSLWNYQTAFINPEKNKSAERKFTTPISILSSVSTTTVILNLTENTNKLEINFEPIGTNFTTNDTSIYELAGETTEPITTITEESPTLLRRKRETITTTTTKSILTEDFVDKIAIPGACLAGCAKGFYIFTFISFLINWFGATGRIGNILLNFRVVSKEDKSFSQGLALMMISLFALIPGPIIYGYIIDSACIIWNYKCGSRGNCQMYDPTQFRWYLNMTAFCLTFVGVLFDTLVWWYSKDVDLYGDDEQKPVEDKRKHISPLLSKKL